MTEWGVVGVIIALVGLLVTIIKPITTLVKSLTTLTEAVRQLQTDVQNQRDTAKESHEQIWGTVNEHTDKLYDHETRIHDLERDGGHREEA